MAGSLRVPMTPLASGERALDEEASRYVVRVHRLRDGDAVTLFDPFARTEADGVLAVKGRGDAFVRVGEIRPATLVARCEVALLQAVAKGDKMDAIVRDATELGATRIAPMITRRTVAEKAQRRGRVRWERIAIEAARQCGRGDIPAISEPLAIAEVVADTTEMRKLALVTVDARPLSEVVGSDARSFAVAVGPEGGFDDDEMELLAARGFVAASLGRFTLRTETAATAALAVLADRIATLSFGSLPFP
jgi:16S rRNA (uracil1498-N3)-methyltransferase